MAFTLTSWIQVMRHNHVNKWWLHFYSSLLTVYVFSKHVWRLYSFWLSVWRTFVRLEPQPILITSFIFRNSSRHVLQSRAHSHINQKTQNRKCNYFPRRLAETVSSGQIACGLTPSIGLKPTHDNTFTFGKHVNAIPVWQKWRFTAWCAISKRLSLVCTSGSKLAFGDFAI